MFSSPWSSVSKALVLAVSFFACVWSVKLIADETCTGTQLSVSVSQPDPLGPYVATIDTDGGWMGYSYRGVGNQYLPPPSQHVEIGLHTTCQSTAEVLTVQAKKINCPVVERTQSVGPPDTAPRLTLTVQGIGVGAHAWAPNSTAVFLQAVEFKYGQNSRVSYSGPLLWGRMRRQARGRASCLPRRDPARDGSRLTSRRSPRRATRRVRTARPEAAESASERQSTR